MSAEQARRIAANLPGMVFQCVLLADGGFQFPFVSGGCQAVYGLAPQEIMADPSLIVSVIHPEDIEAFTASVTETFQHLTPWQWEGRIVTRTGQLKWVQGTSHPERLADGAVVCEGMLCDVTERREAQEALRAAERDYRSMFENAVEGIFRTTPEGRFLSANPALARLLGYDSPEEVMRAADARHTYTDPTRRQEFRRLLQEQGGVIRFEAEHHRGDGGRVWLSMSARIVRDGAGAARYYEGTVQDVTERRRAEEALRRAETGYRSIFEHALEGIYQGTEEGRLISANPALARMMGFASPEELLATMGQTIQTYVDPQRHADFARLMRERDSVIGFEYQVYGAGGAVLWLSESARAVRDGAGRLLYYEGTIQDITQRKDLEAERERLLAEALERADYDPLTGLLNHRAFHKRFGEEAVRAEREGTRLAVAVLDLDNFKFFNDAYGHAAGDDVLRRVAETLRGGCRSYDVLARFGGDEFALLMPHTGAETAAGLAARLKGLLGEVGYRPTDSEVTIPLTLSVGLAVYPEDGQERHQVLEAADARLRHTKTGGSDDIEDLRSRLTDSVTGFSMLDALVTAVDNKDSYTRRHSEDVMRHALQIGRALGLLEAALRTLQVAALLHDVGKIGVPDRVLRKPGALTEEEFEAVKQHPTMGAVIVGAVAGFEDTLDAVRHHHERWDGRGYPAGLTGKETPLLARIMAVADAFSAMTMDRPYRKGKYPDEAQAILKAGAGSQWDPDCVAAFDRTSDAPLLR